MSQSTHAFPYDRVPLWRVRLADLRGRGVYAGVPDEKRCIFIHIPKTAGTSVAQTLFGAASRHVPYIEYLRANPHKFARYFKFSFVRDPWDRLVSTYFFLKNGGMNETDLEWSRQNLEPYKTFDDFVCRGLARPEIVSWVHFRPQADFILSPDDQQMMDFVGRFERLERDFGIIADRLGVRASLQSRNAGEHMPFESYYTLETANVVARVYARDVAAFGYRSPV